MPAVPPLILSLSHPHIDDYPAGCFHVASEKKGKEVKTKQAKERENKRRRREDRRIQNLSVLRGTSQEEQNELKAEKGRYLDSCLTYYGQQTS
jgi:hypothetical protein